MYEMSICSGSGQVLRRYDLSRVSSAGRKVLIGRAEDCDVRIKNSAVSRHHCAIEAVEDDEWLLRDLGSTLGTTVNGEKITEVEIEPGLEVCIGPATLKFEPVPSRKAAEIASVNRDEEPGR
ncbi:MAG: FHA domain-containing protein [Phycisphaerales bacterium]